MRRVKTAFHCALLLLAGLLLPGAGQAAEPTLHDLQGNERQFTEFRDKWVLVNYWATWCIPCLEEIPELVRFQERHREGDAVVIGVNMEQLDREALKAFMDELTINYPVWTTAPARQTPLGPLSGLPTSFLISPRGEVMARQVGVVSATMIEQFIQRHAADFN